MDFKTVGLIYNVYCSPSNIVFIVLLLSVIEPMDVDRHVPTSGGAAVVSSFDVPSSKVTVLRGHQSEVFTCAWNPEGDTIVSGCAIICLLVLSYCLCFLSSPPFSSHFSFSFDLLPPSLSLSFSHTHTHTRTHSHSHTHTHTLL